MNSTCAHAPTSRQLRSLQHVFDSRILRAQKSVDESREAHLAATESLHKSVNAVSAKRNSLHELNAHLRMPDICGNPDRYTQALAVCEVIKRDLAREAYIERNAIKALNQAAQDLARDRLYLANLEMQRQALVKCIGDLRCNVRRQEQIRTDDAIEDSAALLFSQRIERQR